MPPAPVDRGEVWWTDLGMAAKIRPCVVLSIAPDPNDMVLYTIVPYTTTLHGSRFEVPVHTKFLKPGAFNAQHWAHTHDQSFSSIWDFSNPMNCF